MRQSRGKLAMKSGKSLSKISRARRRSAAKSHSFAEGLMGAVKDKAASTCKSDSAVCKYDRPRLCGFSCAVATYACTNTRNRIISALFSGRSTTRSIIAITHPTTRTCGIVGYGKAEQLLTISGRVCGSVSAGQPYAPDKGGAAPYAAGAFAIRARRNSRLANLNGVRAHNGVTPVWDYSRRAHSCASPSFQFARTPQSPRAHRERLADFLQSGQALFPSFQIEALSRSPKRLSQIQFRNTRELCQEPIAGNKRIDLGAFVHVSLRRLRGAT